MKKIKKFLNIIVLIIVLLLTFSSCKENVDDSNNNNNVNNNQQIEEQYYTITLDYQNDQGIKTIQTKGVVEIDDPIWEGNKFLGWYVNEELFNKTTIEADVTLTAKWLKLGVNYNLYYDVKGGTMPADATYKYETGVPLTLPIPTKKYHEFLGWYLDDDFDGEALWEISDTTSGAKTLYAKWKDIAEYKSITYITNGGLLSEEAIDRYIPGETYDLLAAKKEGYFFRGWYDNKRYIGEPYKGIDATNNKALTLYAKWEEKKLENSYISIYGDSVSTFAGWLPEGYAPYYPINPVNVLNVEETWWYNAISKVNAKFLMNASYSNTGVVTTGSAEALKGTEISRIKNLRKDNQDPDIIIIYLGINDCKRDVSAKNFKEGYITMIERMQKEFVNTDIMICTLNACSFSFQQCYALLDEYNVALREIASEFNLALIELDKVITEENKAQYMANMLHPNRAGMDEIANEVIKVLKNKYQGE